MVMVVVFEFSVMRCQPLRRALGANELMDITVISKGEIYGRCKSIFKSK
ncbi:acetyltransferase [Vibrio cholerae]|nr:acetyltransferase [Vibrio cholerae]EGR0808931.1 acetyltransferase [Vibrio cholerae]EGR0812849.1 acetyltransferase [Vibrio cholerae]EGR3866193.1 acetyltransferase [Vibrio cholerae]